MPPKKYLDFSESEPLKQITKHFAKNSDDTRTYVSITCPHCKESFVQIPSEYVVTNKASECLKHLRVCEQAKALGVQTAPRKRRAVANETPADTRRWMKAATTTTRKRQSRRDGKTRVSMPTRKAPPCTFQSSSTWAAEMCPTDSRLWRNMDNT